MKDYLKKLAREVSYAALIERAEKNSQATVWGMGVLMAYSPEPYAYEIQGLKRGRFLKKMAEPARHRHYYLKDSQGRIISAVSYAKFISAKSQWIVCRSFYEYLDDQVIEYAFSGAFESNMDANINAVELTRFKEGRASLKCAICGDDVYVETSYLPESGEINLIREIRHEFTTTERVYLIERHEGLSIIEITDGKHIKIYPEV